MKPNTKRRIIEIDEDLCTGCGDCIPACAEGALQIVDGKARLVGDILCDGLGACVGHCPVGAMSVTVRDAEPYDERTVMEGMIEEGPGAVRAHLSHLLEHGELEYHREAVRFLEERQMGSMAAGVEAAGASREEESISGCSGAGGGCPGSAALKLTPLARAATADSEHGHRNRPLGLSNWPVQISLVSADAPYLDGADILIAADCTAFATPAFHADLADGRIVLIGCPKLDDARGYVEKLSMIMARNNIKSVTVAYMTVPCCFGMVALVREAIARSEKEISLREVVVGLDGEISDGSAGTLG